MPIPATQIVSSGTPITNQLGVGAVSGNAIAIGGLTYGPNQPGWNLIASQGGPGFVTGTWQYGAGETARTLPAQGAFYRSGSGAGGGGNDEDLLPEAFSNTSAQGITKAGWVIIGLIATLLLTDKGR